MKKKLRPGVDLNLQSIGSESVVLTTTPPGISLCLGDKTEIYYMYTRADSALGRSLT